MSPQRPPTRRVLKSSPFAAPAVLQTASEKFEVGDRVTHDRLGLGRIIRILDDADVVVEFSSQESLRSVSCHKLEKL